jgi:hypothetical protein
VFAPLRDAVRLRSTTRRRRVLLRVSYGYLIERDAGDASGYRVENTGYLFRILDPDEHEILAYHWHPVGRSSVTHPHLHLSSRIAPISLGRGQDDLPLADVHIATGFIDFADVVRMLVEEFGVEPLRDDWRDVLSAPVNSPRAVE